MATWNKTARATQIEPGMPMGLLLALTYSEADSSLYGWHKLVRSGAIEPGMALGLLLALTYSRHVENQENIWTKINYS